MHDFDLCARVIDYDHCHPASSETVRFFIRLGFACHLDTSRRQIGVSCGYVAARVAIDLKMNRYGGQWLHLDVTRAADQEWITKGNVILGSRPDDPLLRTPRIISNTEVQSLATSWLNDEIDEIPESMCTRCMCALWRR